MASLWHTHAMPRIRVSTTVDGELLETARQYMQGAKDAELLDEALRLLVAREHRSEIDRQIRDGYDRHPIDEPDEWGSLADWVAGVHQAKSELGGDGA